MQAALDNTHANPLPCDNTVYGHIRLSGGAVHDSDNK
jgi:hypothetical protein